jgi:MFS family permease
MADRVLPPAGPPRVLALAQLTNSIGDGAFYVTSALFFTRVVGLSATQIGLGLTVGWAVGFCAGIPLGHLADRRGPRRVAIVLAVATAAAIAVFLVVRAFPPFLLAACLYASCQCGLTAARQALLASLVPPAGRTKIRAYLSSTTNAGLAIGATLGGVALRFDTAPAYLTVFCLDAASFALCALVLRRLPVPAHPVAVTQGGKEKLAVLRDRPYAVLSVLNMVLQLHIPLINLAIPLWIVTRTHAPTWMVAALLVLNTITVVLFQVRVAGRVTSVASAARQVRWASVVLLAACTVFALSALGTSAVLACVILLSAALLETIGEMMQAGGSWEIGFALAPQDKLGQYQGLYGNGLAVARMLGPLLLTSLILEWGMPGWIVLGCVFLIAGIVTVPAVRWAEGRADLRVSPIS